MLYAHGPDLCRGSDLRHAMANCFEAVMAAVYLEAGLDEVKRIFCEVMFDGEKEMQRIWTNHPPHPLQVWIKQRGGGVGGRQGRGCLPGGKKIFCEVIFDGEKCREYGLTIHYIHYRYGLNSGEGGGSWGLAGEGLSTWRLEDLL